MESLHGHSTQIWFQVILDIQRLWFLTLTKDSLKDSPVHYQINQIMLSSRWPVSH